MSGDELLEGVVAERLELGVATPRLGHEAVAALAGVERDEDAGVVELLPHGVVVVVAVGAVTERILDRPRPHHHDPRTALERPVDLVGRSLRIE